MDKNKRNLKKILTGSMLIIPTLLVLTGSSKTEAKMATPMKTPSLNSIVKPIKSAVKNASSSLTKLNAKITDKIDGFLGKKPSYTDLATKKHAFSKTSTNSTVSNTKKETQTEAIYEELPVTQSPQGQKMALTKYPPQHIRGNSQKLTTITKDNEPIYENILQLR